MSAVIVFVVWAVIVAIVATIAVKRSPKAWPAAPKHGLPNRLKDTFGAAVARFGRPALALCAYACGIGVIILICWPAGLLAHAGQGSIDWPVFRWFEARQVANWSHVWRILTNVGMPRLTQAVTLTAAIFFGVVWAVRRRPWWVPVLVFPVAYLTVKYLQIFLQDVVHRGHPPTTLGTYPSGGCARVILIYGLVVLATLMWRWPHDRRAWMIGGSIVASLWSIQAYARIYNLEHWITDVVGGTIFGLLALATISACFLIMSPVGDKKFADVPASMQAQTAELQ